MGERVILTLMEGSFEQGFPVILRISEDEAPTKTGIQVLGKLPPAPNVLEAFKNWKLAYRRMAMLYSRIQPKPEQVTNVSYHQLADDLAEGLNDWLNSGFREWQKIRDGLQRSLSDTDEIQFIIQTNDIQLRQLPWHLWDFFEDYPKAEVALSAPEYQPVKKSSTKNPGGKVKILAILGNRQGIDIEKDRAFLEQFSDKAQTKFLVEPQPEELNDHLWENGWDILFFAGHSSSQEKGILQLNQTDSLTLDRLRYALKKAIEGGLQLAIFNSCDGLGLARDLADLHIGQVIVMRELVPDVVAQEFLRHFLRAFSGGESLYASVREARERLQGLESKFPCASWLPVICQNPAEAPMTWLEGCVQEEGTQLILPNCRNFMKPKVLLLLSLGVLGCLFSLSWLANWYGVKNHLAGQLPKAQFGYSWALKLNPLSAAAHYNQGSIYEDQQNYERAYAEYQLAIEGGLIEAYNNQGRLYILEGNYEAAVSLLRLGLPLVKHDQVRALMYKNLGWARLEQGRYDEAKLDLTESIKLKSDRSPAYCLLAQVLEREGDKKGALVQWENCLGFAYQPSTPEEDKWVHLARQSLDAEESHK
jgi:tetratricopeptide (TPR) repeat protein